jgi:hypothetical protein
VQQPLIVKLDPRVQAGQADLEAQLALARRILSGVEVSYDEFQKVKALKAALEEKKKDHEKETAETEKQLKAVEDGTKAAPGLGPVNRDLTRLLNSVEAADQRPTDPQWQAVNESCEALSKVMGLWKQLNANLRQHNPLRLPVQSDTARASCTE